jgi:hypothetical protein|tara:strand:- start:1272 stop:1880 length:609 start_codon:yes stop_codon:yes gene_type:complete
MKSVYKYIVRPLDDKRYTNSKPVGDKELILNTDNYNHNYTNRFAKVVGTPSAYETPIQIGDIVVVHHNVFRRWKDMRGKEKDSKSYYKDDMWFVANDQIFLYKRYCCWEANDGFCFVKPIKAKNKLSTEKTEPQIGILKYADDILKNAGMKAGDLVGFKPNTEYEFIIDGELYYRIFSNSITIKYEYQGDEEEYNPSWTESS